MSLGREGVAYTLGGSAFGGAVKPVEGESRRTSLQSTRCRRNAATRCNSRLPWCLLKLRINRAGLHSLLPTQPSSTSATATSEVRAPAFPGIPRA